MAKRVHKHGKDWRQVVVDCGCMCVLCYAVDGLEFHEPFGENKYGWLMFQARVLLCAKCHSGEHERLFGWNDEFDRYNRFIRRSHLSEDIEIEIMIHGGYYQWLKDFGLQDTFGKLLVL